MTYNKKAELRTQTQEDKAIFLVRVVRIGDNTRIFIKKCSLSFCERNAMFLAICRFLSAIPFEFQPIHGIIL